MALINEQTLVPFEEMKREIALFETAIAAYAGGSFTAAFSQSASWLPEISSLEN